MLVLQQQRLLIHVLVHLRVVLDVLGAVDELERGQRLQEALEGGRDHRHHGRLAVPPEAVLQDARQLRVAVRDVLPSFLVGQRGYNVAQGGQRLVDLFGLFEAAAGGAGEADPLRSRQIHKVQLAHFEALLGPLPGPPLASIGMSTLSRLLSFGEDGHVLRDDDEHRVRATTELIQLCGPHRALRCPALHQAVDFRGRAHHPLREAFHEDASALLLADGKVGAFGL
mmetsp:Transcript_25456/g.42643  ORF Transcript_25456/g.42643 Transcript_25456/m.42643 type:complete len:226 (-) Transcript_25456:451-1128(-)